jgi:hypothetical protein
MKLSSGWVKWLVLSGVVMVALYIAIIEMGLVSYVQNWGAVAFKALSGGALGWFISRYVNRLDISKLPAEQRPMAGLSLAVLIGLFAHALATGA